MKTSETHDRRRIKKYSKDIERKGKEKKQGKRGE